MNLIGTIIFMLLITFVAEAAPEPKLRCELKSIKGASSIVLKMPLPHGHELGVWTPNKKFLFIAFEPEENVVPPIPSSSFKKMSSLTLGKDAVGLEVISPKSQRLPVLTLPGRYRFIVSENLETEDELGLNLLCDVKLSK
jgi:hypothetical protein